MFLFRSMMALSFSLSTLFSAQVVIAGETFQCEEVELIVYDQVQNELGRLCTVSHKSSFVHGLSPLESLSYAAKSTNQAASEHCVGQGLVRALSVKNFLRNNFLVESTGALNTEFGADAFLSGKFLCIPKTVIDFVEWRRPLN